MKIIYKPKGAGKTTELIKECAKHGGYIICHNKDAVEYIERLAKHLKIKIPQPITYYEFVKREYNYPGIKNFHIDNADHFIRFLSPVPIKTITINNEEN